MTVDLKCHPDSDGDTPHSSPSLLSAIKRKILGGKAKARYRFASLGVYGFACPVRCLNRCCFSIAIGPNFR